MKMHLYPRCWATRARPMPVLPLVGSTIVPPGRSAPPASAASTMRTAIRSFTDPPGLRYSTLASTRGAPGPRSRVTELSRTSGVLPTRSTTDSAYCTGTLPGGRGGRAHPTRPATSSRPVGGHSGIDVVRHCGRAVPPCSSPGHRSGLEDDFVGAVRLVAEHPVGLRRRLQRQRVRDDEARVDVAVADPLVQR